MLALAEASFDVSLQEIRKQREQAQQTLDTLRSDASEEAKTIAVENFCQTNYIWVPESAGPGMTFERAMTIIAAMLAVLTLIVQLRQSSVSDEDVQRIVRQAVEQVQDQQTPPHPAGPGHP